MPDLTIDEWNEIYLELSSEVNHLLAKQLIEDRKQDAGADFELNQLFSEMAIEVQAETLDPNNHDSNVCALCRQNIARRVQGSRVVCELPGCLDLDVHFSDFRVEDLMIKLCQLFDEHKKHSTNDRECDEEDGGKVPDCCNSF